MGRRGWRVLPTAPRIECRPAVLEPARGQLKWVATIAAAAGLVALGGCGDGGGDPKTGKQLFVQSCGSCHTLASANTEGTIGPNLDDAFAQSIHDGLGRDTIQGVVRKQISLPLGEMPADLVTGKDADSVAAYVADVAAKPGGSGATGGGATKPAAQVVAERPRPARATSSTFRPSPAASSPTSSRRRPPRPGR